MALRNMIHLLTILLHLSLLLTTHLACSQPGLDSSLSIHPGKRLLQTDSEGIFNTAKRTVNGDGKVLAPASCQLGTAPGLFDMNATAGERWQLFSDDCKLQNYVSQYNDPQKAPSLPPMSVLFMSDSMDMKLLIAFCQHTKRKVDHSVAHIKFNQCSGQDNGPLSVAQVYLPSLTSHEKVFIIDSYPTLDGYKTKMAMAKAKWQEGHGGEDPKVVVLGGGLWDIFRWLKAPVEHLEPIERTVRQTNEISLELLSWWEEEVRKAIQYAKQLFPSSKLVWRTFATPSYDLQTGATHNKNIGNKVFVVQMRSAGWAAALDEGLDVVDVDSIVQEFPHPKHYLQDKHHAKPEVMLEVLNIIINIGLQNQAPSTSTSGS